MFTSVIEVLADLSLNWKKPVHIVLRGFRVSGVSRFRISRLCGGNDSRPFELPEPEMPKRGLTGFGLFAWDQRSRFFWDFANRKFVMQRL
jgi:hypothetical protein